MFSGDENCPSLISRSLPVLTISGERLRKKNEAKTRRSFGTETSRAMCEGTCRAAQCGRISTPHLTRGSVRICRSLPRHQTNALRAPACLPAQGLCQLPACLQTCATHFQLNKPGSIYHCWGTGTRAAQQQQKGRDKEIQLSPA